MDYILSIKTIESRQAVMEFLQKFPDVSVSEKPHDNYCLPGEPLTVEEYRRATDEALADVRAGNFYTHEEVEREMEALKRDFKRNALKP